MSRQGIIIAKGVALYEANKPRAAFNAFKEASYLQLHLILLHSY